MNDSSRIDELETRVAFQEHTLNELSDALADAREEISRITLLMTKVVEELKSARGAGVSVNAADEPPPPHY